MKFPLLARLRDIKTRLGPTPLQMGVKPSLVDDEEYGLTIQFYGERGLACPIALTIADPLSANWEGCTLIHAHFNEYKAGDNGWTHFHNEGYATEVELDADPEKAMDTIGAAIVDAGTILTKAVGTNTKCWELVQVYEQLREFMSEAKFPISCERDDLDLESLSFVDPNDTEWRVLFDPAKTRVLKESVEIAAFNREDFGGVSYFVGSRMAKWRDPALWR